MTAYIDYIELLPDSIYATDSGSNNYKLWGLFAAQMEELDIVFNDLSIILNYAAQEGEALDLIGKIIRESRQGRVDAEYIKYITISVMKYMSTGAIEALNQICRMVLGSNFLYVRELYEAQGTDIILLDGYYFLDGSVYLCGAAESPGALFLDGSWFLNGSDYLKGDIYQPAFFEVVVTAGTSTELKTFILDVITKARGAAIKFRIREE